MSGIFGASEAGASAASREHPKRKCRAGGAAERKAPANAGRRLPQQAIARWGQSPRPQRSPSAAWGRRQVRRTRSEAERRRKGVQPFQSRGCADRRWPKWATLDGATTSHHTYIPTCHSHYCGSCRRDVWRDVSMRWRTHNNESQQPPSIASRDAAKPDTA
jgi:hypothetical protein